MKEFGEFAGWLIIVFYVATLLNFLLKYISKKWGKKIRSNETGKKILNFLLSIFVKYHKIFGFLTAALLILHFFIQFSIYGLNLTGGIAAMLILLQILLGILLSGKKRSQLLIVIHRIVAICIALGISLHLIAPWILNISVSNNSSVSMNEAQISDDTTTSDDVPASDEAQTSDETQTSDEAQTSDEDLSSENTSTDLEVFTPETLAQYNGEDGQPAYVAYDGTVYDVSAIPQWAGGKHNGLVAGTDVTEAMSESPHGTRVLTLLPIVGTYSAE